LPNGRSRQAAQLSGYKEISAREGNEGLKRKKEKKTVL
jgi:hypothetical protein